MHVQTTTSTPTSTDLTDTAQRRIANAATDDPLVRVRPFTDTEGFAAGHRLIRALHRQPAGSLRRGQAPVYAAELWFRDGRLTFQFQAPDPAEFRDLLAGHYPNSETQISSGSSYPFASTGTAAAAATLQLRQDAVYPLKHRQSTPPLDADPYRTVLAALRGSDAETALLQIVFMPVTSGWTRRGLLGRLTGGDVERVAASHREGSVHGRLAPEVIESPHNEAVAADIAAQRTAPAFATTTRVVTLAPAAATAEQRLARVVDAVRCFDHAHTDQGLEPAYASPAHVPAVIAAAAQRALTPASLLHRLLYGRATVLTVPELAGLIHLPNDAVEVPAIDWVHRAAGGTVPADAATHEATRAGDTAAETDPAARDDPTRPDPDDWPAELSESPLDRAPPMEADDEQGDGGGDR